jgi:hypothetical protein
MPSCRAYVLNLSYSCCGNKNLIKITLIHLWNLFFLKEHTHSVKNQVPYKYKTKKDLNLICEF